MDYVRLSTNLYIHLVRLSRNLYIHYVRLSTSYILWLDFFSQTSFSLRWRLICKRTSWIIESGVHLIAGDGKVAKPIEFCGRDLAGQAWAASSEARHVEQGGGEGHAGWCFPILSYITGGAPDLQCKFENHWRPGLSRPGRPIVQFTADLEP